jgi:hypothetical protein
VRPAPIARPSNSDRAKGFSFLAAGRLAFQYLADPEANLIEIQRRDQIGSFRERGGIGSAASSAERLALGAAVS